MAKECKSCELTVSFPNPKARRTFIDWLCESGEQDYWTFMECQDDYEHTMVHFDYKGDIIETSLYHVED